MLFRLRRTGLLLLAALTAGSCGFSTETGPTPDPDPSATMRVLFIGNSLTYANDLPGMLKALADSTGVERTYVESLAYPNYALEDHWFQGQARAAIARGGWRYVILQQGPSALEDSRVNLLDFAGRFAEDIRKVNAQPAMYMVWPSLLRFDDFDRVSESYRLAAEATDGALFPVGEAWRAAWSRKPTLILYGPDQFHPSTEGTYLAALTIYGLIYDTSPVGLPTRFQTGLGTVALSTTNAAIFQEAAEEAIATFGRR